MERFIEHTRKEVAMVKVRAIRDFPGSTLSRDELGLVKEGTELEVSGNDAAWLERDGYVERVEEEPTPAETPVVESSRPGNAGETPDPAAKVGEGEST